MSVYEYKVVPAPSKGVKAKGLKTSQDRFANALQAVMNEYGAQGWEYQRTDTLPCEEREGLMGKATHFQHMLVFRRTVKAEAKVETATETVEAKVEPQKAEPEVPAQPVLKQPTVLEPRAPVAAPSPVPNAAPRPDMAAQ